MKSKKLDPKNTKKSKSNDDQDDKVDASPADNDELAEHPEDHPDAVIGALPEDADVHINPEALVAEEVAEVPDEVGFDDLTDDEREMLGLEAKPKPATEEGEEIEAGTSWQEFGYDEEELQ